ncbi:MAG TPA: ATP-dependent DNA helicase RecG [bacterium]|jgi:ATP-dependent DNA helicase RecG|nr:ATP-dependent DNA helicase RecG [bacterium]
MGEDFIKSPLAGQAAGERLLKPLALELKQGCLDKAVTGGLEAYVSRWMPELGPLFAGYGSKTSDARKKIVSETLSKIKNTKEGAAQADPGAGPKARPPALEAGAGARRAPAAVSPPMALLPSDPVTRLSSLGPKRAAALRGLGIQTVGDLLLYTPRAWQDRSRMKTISMLQEGEIATVQARVLSSVNFRVRGRLTITEVAAHDPTGTLSVTYFNQPFQQRRFTAGALVVLSGKVQRRGLRWQMQNPEAEVLPEGGEEALVHTGRVVPLYSLNKELSQRVFRSAVWQSLPALKAFEDPLPEALRREQGLAPLAGALEALHFPPDHAAMEPARRRMAFQELFLLSLALVQKKRRDQDAHAPSLAGGDLPQRLLKALPFELTAAQARVWKELKADLGRHIPMRRLIQGDVGAGKTVLAALCLAAAVGEGWQGAMMAPTEILAEQHLRSLRRMLEPLGVEVLSLTQAQKGKGRREVMEHLVSGRPLVAVGTQALIQEGVSFGHLGLAVVDEQHRFGVMQRLTLSKKARAEGRSDEPHSLVMTATPIPRTLAMTVYGDLDVSVLDGLPPGRSPVKTRWVREDDLEEVWELARQQVAQGRQAYVVVPLVDESDKSEWKAATSRVEELRAEVFPGLDVQLLHGRLKPEEKEAVMEAFTSGRSPILCSTTVVEVGVDVPNASVMVIEDADRFGLAQLHQLRGRVGRGAAQSYCFLVGDPSTEEGRRRLEVMASTNDGFVIAEEDMRLRGPGEVLGTRQSGLPELRHADLVKDQGLVAAARKAADALIREDPALAQKEHAALAAAVKAGFGAKLELGTVG